MSGEHFPKETQRMCNGASGQVPPIGCENSPKAGAAFLDLEWLRLPADTVPTSTPEDKAIDAADRIVCQSLDMAQHVIGHSPSVRNQVMALAAVHAQVAATAYAAHLQADAIREVAPEIAGAISENGTDIGSGIALALEQAIKGFTNEKTDND